MAGFINNKTLRLLDEKLDVYLVYLVHIQQSINLSLSGKLNAFNESDHIGNDINSYNEKDFDTFIEKTMGPIINKINSEIAKYDQRLSFNNKEIFSMREIIQKLEERKENTVYLTKDRIDRLLGYKILYKNKKDEEIEKELDKETAKAKKKLEDEFESVRFKTFKEFIRNPNNRNVDYLYKTNKYIVQNCLERTIQFLKQQLGNEKGAYFIQSPTNDIEFWINEGNINIEYKVSFIKGNDSTNLKILGYIKHIESKIDFELDETYSNGLISSVINALNLAPLIKKYNDSYVEHFHNEIKKDDADKKAKKDIDNFLNGDID